MADLKRQIVEALNLKHIKPDEIGDDQPLFGEGDALGLDSIDALELIVLLQQHHQVKLDNPQEGPKIFKSVRTIAEFVQSKKN